MDPLPHLLSAHLLCFVSLSVFLYLSNTNTRAHTLTLSLSHSLSLSLSLCLTHPLSLPTPLFFQSVWLCERSAAFCHDCVDHTHRYDEVVKCIQPLATSGLATSSSGGSSTEDASGQPSYRNITQLVEHPVPFYTNAQKKAAPVLAVQLTKQVLPQL